MKLSGLNRVAVNSTEYRDIMWGNATNYLTFKIGVSWGWFISKPVRV